MTAYEHKLKEQAQVNVTLLSDGSSLTVDDSSPLRDGSRGDAQHWTPWIVKPVGFLLLAFATMGLLALSEYAVRSLPHHDPSYGAGGLWKHSNQTLHSTAPVSRPIPSAGAKATSTPNTIPAPLGQRALLSDDSMSNSISIQGFTSSPVLSSTLATNPSAYLNSVHSIHGPSSEHSTPLPKATSHAAYMNSAHSLDGTGAPYTSAYLTPAKTVNPPHATSTLYYTSMSSAYMNSKHSVVASPGPTTEAATTDGYITPEHSLVSSVAPSAYLGAHSHQVSTSLHTPGEAPPSQYLTPGPTFSASPTSYFVSNHTHTVLSPAYDSLRAGCTAPPTTTVRLVQTVQIVAYSDFPKHLSWDQPDDNQCDTEFKKLIVIKYPWWASVIVAIVPVAIIVLYNQLWQLVYTSVKVLEPWAQLAKPEGSPAKRALFMKFISASIPLNPFQDMVKGDWLLCIATAAFILAQASVAVGSEILLTDTHSCRVGAYPWDVWNGRAGDPNPCVAEMQINVDIIRALQALLALLAVALIVIAITTYRRGGSRVYSDPSSILGVAPMIHHPQLFQDFLKIPPGASTKHIKARLGERRYRLAHYESHGNVRYGIVPLPSSGDFKNDETTSGSELDRRQNWIPYIFDTVLFFAILGMNGVVIAYKSVGGHSGFNDFFNSATFGPRFVLTAAATVITILWRRIYAEVTTKSILTELSRGNAKVSSTLSVTHHSLPIVSLFTSLSQRHYLSAFVSFIVVLADTLCVVIGNVPFRSGERRLDFSVSSNLAVGILGLMSITLVFVSVWRMTLPNIPRNPDCLANIISYIPPGGSLTRMCEGLEYMGSREREKYASQKRWCYTELGKSGKLVIEEDYRVAPPDMEETQPFAPARHS